MKISQASLNFARFRFRTKTFANLNVTDGKYRSRPFSIIRKIGDSSRLDGGARKTSYCVFQIYSGPISQLTQENVMNAAPINYTPVPPLLIR